MKQNKSNKLKKENMTFIDYLNSIYLSDPKVTREISLEDWLYEKLIEDNENLNKWAEEWKKTFDI